MPEAKGKHAVFEGKWAGEAATEPTKKYLLRLSFEGSDAVTADLASVLGGQRYPGPVSGYTYKVAETSSDEGTLELTLQSKKVEGVERITEADKQTPRTWRYKIKSSDAMQLTLHIGQVTVTFDLKREK